MAKDRNGTLLDSPSAAYGGGAEPAASRHRRSKRKHDTTTSSSSSSDDESSRSRKIKHKSSRSSSRRRRRSSSTDSSSSSDSDSDRDRRRRRREKERRKEKEERRRKREKERKKKKKEKGVKGAVTSSWGKYGIIRETDMWNKRPEFTAWLSEVKKMNLETLPNWEEKQMFKDFMEDHNTATFPSKKYYGLDAYHHRQLEKEIKRGSKKVKETERIVFNDEEQRRQELLKIREKQKEEQVEALKCSMQSGMAQAMKEQSRLREEMAYQYKLGNFEAATAIQRRLDPDAAP